LLFVLCLCAGPAADPGINSRALAELFQVAQERGAEVAYSLSASVLEIYQEQIFDLLTGSKDTGEPGGAQSFISQAKLCYQVVCFADELQQSLL
jgi:hypothetical protein